MKRFLRASNGMAAFCLGMMATMAAADPFPEVKGDVVLVIDGRLGGNAPDAGYPLDMEGLASLPKVEFETSTIWSEGVSTYTGVSLKQLLTMAGVTEGTIVEAEALNGYIVEISMEEIDADYPIVAYHINGKPFPRREKGPLWIVYPYDTHAEYKTELTYANSVWQLQKLTVR